jgi:branched-chain amino acid transport system ATP-binding protein
LGRDSYAGRAAAMCETVGLDGVDRYASELSFGELRLLEVARAMAQEPTVLLLDEPFPGLEDDGVAKLSAAIRRVADSGRAVILVDHNLTLVQAVVDRVILLARGAMAFAGTAAECLVSPEFQYEYVGGSHE